MSIPRLLRLLPVLLFVALGTAPAHADTVHLANGDRISGRVLHVRDGVLSVQTPWAGTLRIAYDRVSKVDATEAVEGLPARHAPAVVYKGRVTVAANATRGNHLSDRAQGEAEFTARARAYRYRLFGRAERATEAKVEVADAWRMAGNYDRFRDPGRFWYGRASVEHDRFRDVELRSAFGAGHGWQLIETEDTKLALRAGLDLVTLDRLAGRDTSYPALGWGVQASHRLWRGRVELFHDQEGFINLEEGSDVTLRSRTGLRVPIAEGLTASAQVNVDWDRSPGPGRTATDTTWLLGLGYEW